MVRLTAAIVVLPLVASVRKRRMQAVCEMERDCSINPWCQDNGLEDWCRSMGASGHCPGPQCRQGGGGPSPTPTDPPTPTPTPAPPSPPTPPGDKKLMAFIDNSIECPTLQQIQGYSHVIISFAVSYVYKLGKKECDAQCKIVTPVPICGNGHPEKVKEWQDAGVKVLLSFGGRGQGDSWSSSPDNCWEDCYGVRAGNVSSQIATIVEEQGFDGVDIDFEYHVTRDVAVPFLSQLTTDLQGLMPAYKTVSHAPRFLDTDRGDPYYDLIKSISSSVDYLLPQYPTFDGHNPVFWDAHFTDLANDVFGGDASKVLLGFCLSCEAGLNTTQAVRVVRRAQKDFPDNGGVHFRFGADDRGNRFSQPIREYFSSLP